MERNCFYNENKMIKITYNTRQIDKEPTNKQEYFASGKAIKPHRNQIFETLQAIPILFRRLPKDTL